MSHGTLLRNQTVTLNLETINEKTREGNNMSKKSAPILVRSRNLRSLGGFIPAPPQQQCKIRSRLSFIWALTTCFWVLALTERAKSRHHHNNSALWGTYCLPLCQAVAEGAARRKRISRAKSV
jgi:hypothetical protein